MTEVAPSNPLPKPWHDLNTSRAQRQALRTEVEKLRATCQAEDGAKHLIECEKCYHKSLELIQTQYTISDNTPWVSDSSKLKDDLVARIEAIKIGEADLESVEERLEQEKKAWYRQALLENPDLLDFGHNDIRREDLLASLADSECHIDDIINPVWE